MAGLAAALRLADDGDEARLYSRGPVDPYTPALDAFETEQAASAAPPDLRIVLGKARIPRACGLASHAERRGVPLACSPACVPGSQGPVPSGRNSKSLWGAVSAGAPWPSIAATLCECPDEEAPLSGTARPFLRMARAAL